MDIEKLMMAKAIMDKGREMDRGGKPTQSNPSRVQVENFDMPSAKYNIPSDILSEVQHPTPQMPTSKFLNQGYPAASVNAIEKSKLPDAIKKLMIEHPIEQPGGMNNNVTLSDDLIERASRLMGTKRVTEQVTPQSTTPGSSDMREMMKSVVKEVLKENGMLIESVERTNDSFKFQVGNHIFEGKLTKIKKLK